MLMVAVDVGGTFTDVAVYDHETGRVDFSKLSTTQDDLAAAIGTCLERARVDLARTKSLRHGTTIVINIVI